MKIYWGFNMAMSMFFEDSSVGRYSCLLPHYYPFYYPFWGAEHEQKLEPVSLVLFCFFTTQGAIVTRCITEYTYFKRIFDDVETDGDTCILVDL